MLSHYGLIKALWSRHIWSIPSGLWGYVSEDTHSVGWETGALTPFSTMSSKVHSICSLCLMGTFCQACWMGRMLGSVLTV